LKKILISGFGAFDHHTENSSEIIANLFRESSLANAETRSIILPVTFGGAFDVLEQQIKLFSPDFVVCLGLADKRAAISLEKVAINQIHCRISDNEGVQHQDKLISDTGPAAYFSTLPLKEMRDLKTSFPVEMSYSAGTYVCNYLMYRLLDSVQGAPIKAGFIHLPPLHDNKEVIFESLKKMLDSLTR
jgi:pyroglutamyl-peptidase